MTLPIHLEKQNKLKKDMNDWYDELYCSKSALYRSTQHHSGRTGNNLIQLLSLETVTTVKLFLQRKNKEKMDNIQHDKMTK